MKHRTAISLIVLALLSAAVTASAQSLFNEAKLIPNPAALPYWGAGSSVAISGTTAVVGAPYGDFPVARGSAHVYVWNGSTWTTEATLSSAGPDEMDQFGLHVAIQGNTILVGAPYTGFVAHGSGAVYVFERSGTTWTQTAKLAEPDGLGANGYVGIGMALDGDTAVVSDYTNTDPGRLLVFSRTNGMWDVANPQVVNPDNPQNGSFFGGALAMQGNFIVAGASGATVFGQSEHGLVQVFERIQGTWTFKVSLIISDTAAGDRFGQSVAIDGEHIVVGAPAKDGTAGAAYLFHKNGNAWTAADAFWVRLPIQTQQFSEYYGFEVHKSGATVMVAGRGRTSWKGAVYLFTDLTGTSKGSSNGATDGVAGDQFGWSTGIDGTRAVVGANQKNEIGGAYAYDIGKPVSFPRYNWTFTLWPYKYIYKGCPIDLVANGAATIDIDRGELPLSFEIGLQPRNGFVRWTSPTTLVYTPNRGFTGRDVFTVRVADRAGLVYEKTANVTVFAAAR